MPANILLSAIVMAVFVTNAACTTAKPIDLDEPATYADRVHVGDKVRLLYLDERVKEIRVTEVSDQEIVGKLDTGGIVIADWQDVYAVEQVRISPLKTAGAALGIVVAVPVLFVLALASGCAGGYC